MTRRAARYGWRRDLPDHRDHRYVAPRAHLATLPPRVDLRPQCPPVYDQGQLGSCTANAIGAALEFGQRKQGLPSFVPSRLYIYYNERALEGTITSDAGATIRDSAKVIAALGAPPEGLWSYDTSRFADLPPPEAFAEGLKHRAIDYQRIDQSLVEMKGCLASGYPFALGFTVYESFESDPVAQTGDAPLPGPNESVLGGHAVLAVGYDDSTQRFVCRNSWGSSWGRAGYFTLPYAYLLSESLASDFWSIRRVQ